jgi:hypothetical protein
VDPVGFKASVFLPCSQMCYTVVCYSFMRSLPRSGAFLVFFLGGVAYFCCGPVLYPGGAVVCRRP